MRWASALELRIFVTGVIERMKADGRWQEAYDRWVEPYMKEERGPPGMMLQEALEIGA